MKTIKLSLVILTIFFLATNCSVFMAATQPAKKDVHVLDRGTPRNMVISELGPPAYSRVEDGKNCDVFSFVQGYSKGAKVGRTIFHGAADLFTGGLWEIAGTPIEMTANGNEVKVEVYYGANDSVERVNVIRGNDIMEGVTSITKDQKQNPESPSTSR